MMNKIKNCSRDNVKLVLRDLTELLSGKLRYERSQIGEKGPIKKYSDKYLEVILPRDEFKSTDDTKALNLEETIDYMFWHLLLKKDHPLKCDKDRSTVKGYANVNSRSNPSTFIKGRTIRSEGAKLLADMLSEVFYDLEEFAKSDDNKVFINCYNADNNIDRLFTAVSEHLAVLINENAFLPSTHSINELKASKYVYNDNKPRSNRNSIVISKEMLSTAVDDKIETDIFLEGYYNTKLAEELGLGECVLIPKYRLCFIDEQMEIATKGFKIEFDAFYNIIALKKIGFDSFSSSGNGHHLNDNIILPERFSDKPLGRCKFYFQDSMYYEFELLDDSTIYRDSIMKYPIDMRMEPYRLNLTTDKIRIEFYKTMLYFGIRFSMENRP